MFVFDTCFVSHVFLMDSWPCGVMVHKRKIVNLISPCRGTQDQARQSGAQTRLEAPHWLMRTPCRYRGRPPLQNASASNSMTEVAQLLGWCLQFAKHGIAYPCMLILHKLSVWRFSWQDGRAMLDALCSQGVLENSLHKSKRSVTNSNVGGVAAKRCRAHSLHQDSTGG